MGKINNKTLVIILGMHRSGTSCLAGSLQQKGLFLGKVFESNPYNLKGNRENLRIMELNNSVLEYNNGNWLNPPLNINWNQEHIVERNEIINDFLKSNNLVFGFKDPRAIITLPFWADGLSNIQLVGSFRHPLDVASSLNKRNGMPIVDGINLWEIYNNRLLHICKKQKLPLVNFNAEKEEYITRIELISKYLRLNNTEYTNDTPFYDKKLISGKITKDVSDVSNSAIDVYSKLLEIYKKQIIND